MRQNADRAWDAVADEHIISQRQLDDNVQALVVKWVECGRLAQCASDDIPDDVVPLLAGDATTNEIVTLQLEITTHIPLNELMQANLGAALQEVNKIKQTFATTDDERDMISEPMESAMMELNDPNEAVIPVNANLATQQHFSNQLQPLHIHLQEDMIAKLW